MRVLPRVGIAGQTVARRGDSSVVDEQKRTSPQGVGAQFRDLCACRIGGELSGPQMVAEEVFHFHADRGMEYFRMAMRVAPAK